MNSHKQEPLQLANYVVEPRPPSVVRRNLLIGFGAIQVILSLICFISNVILISKETLDLEYLFGIICGFYHVVHGVTAIVGGTDKTGHRCSLAIIVLAVVGFCFINLPLLSADIVIWQLNVDKCKSNCGFVDEIFNDKLLWDYTLCEISNGCHQNVVYISILILSTLIGIVDVILFIVGCYRYLKCCGGNPVIVTSYPQD